MNNYKNTIILKNSSKQLFDIVIDVESYPLFLPWCTSSRIIEKISNTNFNAELSVGYKALDEKYVSRINAITNKEINSEAISGPFKLLKSTWTFNDIDKNNCKVDFFIQYKFKSFFLEKIMGSLFKRATIKMLDAFERRAKELYK